MHDIRISVLVYEHAPTDMKLRSTREKMEILLICFLLYACPLLTSHSFAGKLMDKILMQVVGLACSLLSVQSP